MGINENKFLIIFNYNIPMKKIFAIIFICILACFLNRSFAYENGTYKVIKVIDGDTLFLDFNNDRIPQQEEKVRINGIDTFEVKPSVFLDWQMKRFNFTQGQAVLINYGEDLNLYKLVDQEHNISGGGSFDVKGAKKYFSEKIKKMFDADVAFLPNYEKILK
jgi:hypothetical protein